MVNMMHNNLFHIQIVIYDFIVYLTLYSKYDPDEHVQFIIKTYICQ